MLTAIPSKKASRQADAIPFAWNLLTGDFGIDKSRLLTTVYHTDDEAFEIWKKVGVPEDRIIRIATSDNFWQMGPTGPCGPCTEIFYDHGDHIWGGPPGSADEDGDRFIEIWNVVFMQNEQFEDGSMRAQVFVQGVDADPGLGAGLDDGVADCGVVGAMPVRLAVCDIDLVSDDGGFDSQ